MTNAAVAVQTRGYGAISSERQLIFGGIVWPNDSGQCTRDIDLGGARDLSFVNMTYETFSLGYGTATIQVFARQ